MGPLDMLDILLNIDEDLIEDAFLENDFDEYGFDEESAMDIYDYE